MTWRRVRNWCVMLVMLAIGGYGIAVPPAAGVEKVLFIGAYEYYHTQVYQVNIDGSGLAAITSITQGDVVNLAVSADGRIVYVLATSSTQSAIYLMNADGSNPVLMTPNSASSHYDAPAFSPEGRVLYYTSDQEGQNDIYQVNLDGSHRAKVWHGGKNSAGISLSSNNAIFFHTWMTGTPSDIVAITPDGAKYNVLITNAEDPVANAAGDLLAFDRYTGSGTDVYISNADGSNAHAVTKGGCCFESAFSPKGDRLVYAAFDRTENMLCMVNIDGTNPIVIAPNLRLRPLHPHWVQLTTTPQPVTPQPPWGPDWPKIMNPPQPDLMIGINTDGALAGEHEYDTKGNQSQSQYVPWGRIAVYCVVIKNDGGFADQFVVKGTVGAAQWVVRYYDSNGRDISRQMTGIGVQTPILAPGESMDIRLEVTAASSVQNGSVQEVTLSTASGWDAQVADMVKAVTMKIAR